MSTAKGKEKKMDEAKNSVEIKATDEILGNHKNKTPMSQVKKEFDREETSMQSEASVEAIDDKTAPYESGEDENQTSVPLTGIGIENSRVETERITKEAKQEPTQSAEVIEAKSDEKVVKIVSKTAPKQLRGTVEVNEDKKEITIRIVKVDSSTSDSQEQGGSDNREIENTESKKKKKTVQCVIKTESLGELHELADGNLPISSFSVSCRDENDTQGPPALEGVPTKTKYVTIGCGTDSPSYPPPSHASTRSTFTGTSTKPQVSESVRVSQCGCQDSMSSYIPRVSEESYFTRLYPPNTLSSTPCEFRSSFFKKIGRTSHCPCQSSNWRTRINGCHKYFRKSPVGRESQVKVKVDNNGLSAIETMGRVDGVDEKEKPKECFGGTGNDNFNGNHNLMVDEEDRPESKGDKLLEKLKTSNEIYLESNGKDRGGPNEDAKGQAKQGEKEEKINNDGLYKQNNKRCKNRGIINMGPLLLPHQGGNRCM